METPEPDLLLLSIHYDAISNRLVPVSVGQSEALRIRLETHCYLQNKVKGKRHYLLTSQLKSVKQRQVNVNNSIN